ncbi:AAA family ATPase [Elizabethkingia meningoseptica]|uniref:AAA family ATPase n=1 Tax=Elizabethkingia meningoseptica TaxID=238 RepID=UPI0023B15CEC|nr:AAA family ATPase [Elizabethkingia meningoseptica]MDE5492786.1 ATP-binding protein [Elizabethkingia meningoseptica]
MKNSIQFKHFRKFEDFPKLDFNDITFVVGKNNSGKSTFVKAFVMVYNYLKSGNLKQFDLNQGSVELLNIVTFDRALCKTMSAREKKDYIPIDIKLGNYEFFIEVTGKKDNTILDVTTFKIIDTASHFTIKIEPQKEHAIVSYNHKEIIENDALKEALQQKQKLEQTLPSIKDELSKESIDLKNRIEKLSNIIDNLKDAKTETETSFTVEEFYSAFNFTELFDDLYRSFETKYWIENPNVDLFNQTDSDSLIGGEEDTDTVEDSEEKDISENEVFSDLRYFYINRQKFEKFFEDFIIFIESSKIFYLPATLNKQSALLSIRDKNNDLAEVVHKYYQLGLQNNTIISGFVKHWISEFQIGTDIQIELVNGEAYNVTLTENEVPIPLADKGMGSIQSVLLILRLASVIYFKEQVKKTTKLDYFVIVEEPELNLHPALQSKLCDLFFEVYEKYDVKFIIETHSEYIIRRSQVMNARKEFSFDDDTINPTPFATLYFNSDSEKTAYSMNYQPDGTFENSFGNGFFDASSSSTLELIRLKRQKIQ